MNEEEAQQELTRLKSRNFSLRLGMMCGGTITLALLGLSFIEPHLDFIITVSIWPMIGVGIYLIYLTYKLRKIASTLQRSDETQEAKA